LEGDRLYQQVTTALNSNNFDLARERLTRAGERYDASLAIQDSEDLRAQRDQRLLSMDAEITGRETAIVSREVRELITSAKTVYFNGSFERAEEMLTTAQARWRRVFADPDPELVYWLGLVRNAMALRSGRVIPVTAPLYSEMSQLLSEAHRSYDEGIRLLNQGRRPVGLESLSRARQKTEEVKLVFPVNQEASILQLRIDQVTNPDAFNSLFRDRFNSDMSSIRQFKSAESYADLQDLAAINPGYPGMRSALTEAEILLGLRPPPPDPAALAQSRALTQQAQILVDTSANSPSAMELALETLNQALTLDPNNERAIALKNIVVPLTPGTAQNILTAEAEQEYQRALQELQQGRYIIALDIVQRLLQDPRNKNNAKLLELRRRAESMI
jgi:tetratricopeptide (TPR) repeat protein